MSTRALNWAAGLGAVDILAWVLTIHAHQTYHQISGGPTVMPVGQLLGWVVSIGLLIVVALIVLGSRQQRRWRGPDGKR